MLLSLVFIHRSLRRAKAAMATERGAEDAELTFLLLNREVPIRKKQLFKNLTLFSCPFIMSTDFADYHRFLKSREYDVGSKLKYISIST